MRREKTRAVILAAVYAIFFVLATPGLDGAPPGFMRSEQSIARVSRDTPAFALPLLKFLGTVNAELRRPVVKFLTPLQRPLRLEQTWRLYGDGPELVRKMEIHIDDEVVYRSGDSDLDWEESVWRQRRLRPVPATLADHCRKRKQPLNREGLSRLVMERALRDYPEAQRVEIRILSGRFPGMDLMPSHGVVRAAPDWEMVDLHYGEGPCR